MSADNQPTPALPGDVGTHWRDYSGPARDLYYDGHWAGYMAAIDRLLERAVPGSALNDLAADLRRDYDQVKAAERKPILIPEDHHA